MAWPIPHPKAIAERMASAAETAIQSARPETDPVALSRAVRSARGMFAMLFRVVALELRSVHDHLAWWGRQYFVDTAEEEYVYRHASIWGVTPRAATRAIGTVLIEGEAGSVLPAGLELSASNAAQFVTREAATIGVGGTISMPIEAVATGSAMNLEAGIRLVTITAFPAITRLTIEAPGLAGGAEEASAGELAAATIERIRQPPHGGAGFDYPDWLARLFPVRAVKVATDWIGRGSVGVIVAMKDGDGAREPTTEELADMLDHLGAPGSSSGVRPVTAHVVMVPVVLEEIDLTVRLRPDTVATRAAVIEAWQRFVATIGDDDDELNASPIGARIEPSRISEAISSANGEYAHDLVEPSAPFDLAPSAFPVAADPIFEDPL